MDNVHKVLYSSSQPEAIRIRTNSPPDEDENSDQSFEVIDKNGEVNQAKSVHCHKLAPRSGVHRGLPLDAKSWAEFRAANGSITDPDRVREIVFKGGIADEIRGEVWKYLLGVDLWEHNTDKRDKETNRKTRKYWRMKIQWQSMTPDQETNHSNFRRRRCLIEKDVKRTDRTNEFFAGDDNPNLTMLQEILMTYMQYNFRLGYVQGMSDLLAPILCYVQKQTDSFWCFAGFMDKVSPNFDMDQKRMTEQMEHLQTLLSFVNEKLYRYLDDNQSGNMYFCFQWLLLCFKREFSYCDIIQLWEVLWTGLPCSNFHLFICVAILDQEMDAIIDGQFTQADILKHVNNLSGKLNVTTILEQAESIYLQVKATLESCKSHPKLHDIIEKKLNADANQMESQAGSLIFVEDHFA